MYVNIVTGQNNLSRSNFGFKSNKRGFTQLIKKVSSSVKNTPISTLNALFLSGMLTLGATGCKYDTSSFTPSSREIDTTELAKHSDLTPEEINTCADAISRVMNSPFGDGITNYTYYGVCYDTAKDSSIILKFGIGDNYTHFAYDKQDKSFYDINNKNFRPVTIHHYTDGRFFVVPQKPVKQLNTEINKEKNSPTTGLTDAEINAVADVILDIFNNTRYYKGAETIYTGAEYDKKGKLYLKFKTMIGYEFAYYYNTKNKNFIPDNFLDKLGDPNIKIRRNEKDGSFIVGTTEIDNYREYNKDGKPKYAEENTKGN